jgi:hypothetical protein
MCGVKVEVHWGARWMHFMHGSQPQELGSKIVNIKSVMIK